MKNYKGYEITAINTNGYWYGYASLNGKTVFSSTKGFLNREIAIGITEAEVDALMDLDIVVEG